MWVWCMRNYVRKWVWQVKCLFSWVFVHIYPAILKHASYDWWDMDQNMHYTILTVFYYIHVSNIAQNYGQVYQACCRQGQEVGMRYIWACQTDGHVKEKMGVCRSGLDEVLVIPVTFISYLYIYTTFLYLTLWTLWKCVLWECGHCNISKLKSLNARHKSLMYMYLCFNILESTGHAYIKWRSRWN